ncbi:MAG TPA: hypothetical protein VM658_11410 [bacterium]|nr:hypothetical protein [bacterium]
MARGSAIAREAEDRLFFLVHGVPVALNCDHGEARERIRDHLKVYAAPVLPGGGAGIAIEIVSGDVMYPVPLHAKRVLLYDSIRCYYLSGRMYFTDYFSTLTVEPGGRAVRGNLSPATVKDYGLNSFVAMLFTLTLFEALRWHGLYYLHASALAGPDGTGYVLSGNAGSGKTSLTLALIQSGFKFLSDDTIFLRLRGDRDVEALGFARDFHLPSDLVEDHERLREYRDLPDFGARRGRKLLPPDRCFPGMRLDGLLNPRVILFPCIRDRDSGMEPLSMSQALNILLPQSLSVMFNPATAAAHLEALKRMARHGRGFRLFTGPEVKGDPALARSLVERARDLALDRAEAGQ